MTHSIRLTTDYQRTRAKRLIDLAPKGYVSTLREPTRTLEQNDMMWALLTDISVAMPMGRRHTPDDWKAIFMNACGWECQFLEGLDGRPFPQGFRSSKLTKSQMSALIEMMLAFGTEHGIAWSEPASGTEARSGETRQGLDPKGDGPVRDSADAQNNREESIP